MDLQSASVILATASVFLYGYTLPGLPLNLFVGVLGLALAAVLMLLRSRPPLLHRDIFVTLLVILAVGAVGILLGRGSMGAYITQAFAIVLVTLSAVIVVGGAGENAAKIFPTYLDLSYYFALLALLELVLGLAGIYFEFLTPRVSPVFLGLHRVSGLAAEPAHFCVVMAPSIVAITVSSSLGRPCLPLSKSVPIFASYLLTFSSVGLFVLASTLLLLFFRRTSISALAKRAFLVALIAGASLSVPQINTRVIDTISVFSMSDAEGVNASSLTMYKNFIVTTRSAQDQPFFGAGLGGHEANYYKYLPSALVATGLNLNEKDAASLFLRLISEFGIPFTVLFYAMALFLWTGLPSSDDDSVVFWKKLTSTAVLGMIIANSVRNGNYINHAFPFFLVLYYSAHRSLRFGDVELPTFDLGNRTVGEG